MLLFCRVCCFIWVTGCTYDPVPSLVLWIEIKEVPSSSSWRVSRSRVSATMGTVGLCRSVLVGVCRSNGRKETVEAAFSNRSQGSRVTCLQFSLVLPDTAKVFRKKTWAPFSCCTLLKSFRHLPTPQKPSDICHPKPFRQHAV